MNNAVTSQIEAPKKNSLGVNVAGYINSEFGLGEGARSTIRALEAAEIEFVLNNCDFNGIHRKLDLSYKNFSEENPFSINLIHVNGDRIRDFINSSGDNYFKEKYNIGFWAWELPDFPAEWSMGLNFFDEIWTPSNFCAEAIAAAASIPVVKMPHAIAPALASFSARKSLNLPPDKFIFLFVFDFCSVYERKNPSAIVEAFKKAFDNRGDVLLVIKSSNARIVPQKSAELKNAAKNSTNIRLIDGYLDKKDLNGLINECDCYVSLHRSEGFGLTIAEAMFFGKPVIATDYSATAEFVNVSNGFPVKFDLETLKEDYGHYRKDNVWANPSVEHAAELMRAVFENQQQAREIGAKAASDVRNLLSAEVVGEKMRNRLGRIKYLKNDFVEYVDAEKVETKLDSMRVLIEQKDEELRRLQNKIRHMTDSRFWKMRNQWFKFKRLIRVTDDE